MTLFLYYSMGLTMMSVLSICLCGQPKDSLIQDPSIPEVLPEVLSEAAVES